MKDNKRNIDQFFQEELGGYAEAPPALVWDNLEKKLGDQQSKRPKMFWWLYLFIAAVLVGGSMAAYFNYSKNQKKSTLQNIEQTHSSNTQNTNSSANNSQAIESSLSTDSGANNQVNGPSQNGEQNGGESNISVSNGKLSSNSKGASLARAANANENQNNSLDNYSAPSGNRTSNGSGNSKNAEQSNTQNPGSRKKSSSNSLTDKGNPNNGKDNVVTNSDASANNTNNPDAHDGPLSAASQRKAPSTKNNLESNSKNAASTNRAANSLSTSKGKATTMDKVQSKGQPINPKAEIDSKVPFQSPLAEKAGPKKQNPVASAKDNKNWLMVSSTEDDEKDIESEEAEKEKKADFELDQAAKDKLKSTTAATAKKQTKAKTVLAANTPESNDDEEEEADEKDEEKDQDDAQEANDQAKQNSRSSSGGGGGGGSAKKEKIRKSLNLAIGVKAGYETGYQNITARKNVASIFMEVALSNRINFILQPSIKFGTLNRQISGGFNDTFYNASDISSTRVSELDTAGKPSGFSTYYFSQNIDSLKQSTSSTNKLMEIEVPFLFRYKVDKNFSVLAGINFLFGKTLGFNASENKFANSTLRDSVRKVFDTASPLTPGRFLTPGISGKADIPSDYASPTSPVRFGYTLGLSYVFKEKLMIDFLVQQNLSGTSNLSNAEVRKVFEQPYVRLSLGYVLFGKTKK